MKAKLASEMKKQQDTLKSRKAPIRVVNDFTDLLIDREETDDIDVMLCDDSDDRDCGR